MGWRTVVRPGLACRAAMTSSQPVTARSSGTRRPSSSAASMAPSAISSFAHTRARGRSARSSRSRRDPAAVLVEGARRGGRRHTYPRVLQSPAEAVPPCRRVRRRRRVAEERQRVVAVVRHEVVRQGRRTDLVLGVHGVSAGDRVPRHQHQRQPSMGQVGEHVVADGASEDHQPVDPRGEVEHHLAGGLAAVGRQDQDAAPLLSRDLLVAQDDLGEVGPGQVGEDDPVAAACWPSASERADRLGVKPQVVDGCLDPLPGVRRDARRPAQHPGDGRDRDAGVLRDLVDRRLAGRCGTRCKRFHVPALFPPVHPFQTSRSVFIASWALALVGTHRPRAGGRPATGAAEPRHRRVPRAHGTCRGHSQRARRNPPQSRCHDRADDPPPTTR